ncbi:Peroxygenase 1 [Fulvia fulva]|uniref:Peroxygenase 1 n=1 Tax=Passalora fulva TaxID=5499 RepID=A0A9Q8PEQ0_PASFU|nr:Peroxygenase 1 [Fulvia fulva]KAK4618556.1 Peroxygenase 1 [Fulvia fulva]UJO21108.1 Peroxygenase 1 [Fulvia fulva]WPV33397.1 Peroxygenase 1 [Fulvia fulva]
MPSLASQPQEATNLLRTAAPDATNNDIQQNQSAKNRINHPKTNGINTSLPSRSPTPQRQLYIPHPDDALLDPGTARVNLAVFNETPNGTPSWREKHAHQTVLQQHCSYWDPDADGIIWPLDIYRGCAAWGWHPLLCLLVTIIIAGSMSYPTLPAGRYLPDLWFRIYLNNIHKCKHGSDSNTYDQEGRFRPQQFEDFFAKYDAGSKRGVDLYDLARAHKGQRLLCDPFGWTASMLEWLALYLLIWPKDGILSKDDCRASYDGSIYQRKADEFAAKRIR